MFSGIVEELGHVRAVAGHRLEISCRTVPGDSPIGASIAVNGVCLTVIERGDDVGGATFRIEVPRELLRYVVWKGSLTVDGVSLTVAAIHDDGVSIALIPHTLAVTTLGSAAPGDPVHLEVDVIAKYVERLMQPHQPDAHRGEVP